MNDNTENTPAKIPSQIKPDTQPGALLNQPLATSVNQSVILVKNDWRITPGEFIPASVQIKPSKYFPQMTA